MVAAVMIPAFLAASTQNGSLPEIDGSEMFIAVVIGVLLMVLGNLVFAIYGIIGAIRTYQGKEFRYIFIANHVEKSKAAKPTKSS